MKSEYLAPVVECIDCRIGGCLAQSPAPSKLPNINYGDETDW